MNEKASLGPVHLVENDAGDKLLIYDSPRGAQVELRYAGDTLWLTQLQMADLFGVVVATVSYHLKNIFTEGELDPDSSIKESLIDAADGRIRPTNLYNLDAIISVGYRVSSAQGTAFRKWATGVLVQFAMKGFVIDAPRLKHPDAQDRIAELKEIIRDIRSSEANVYAELRRICAMCQDYDGHSQAAREFYAKMQAKLYWAVTNRTPSMVLHERADATTDNMGLTSWEKNEIRLADVSVAKNFLASAELRELNRLTTILLDIFEDQLDIGRLTLMSQAARLLDEQLTQLGRQVLRHGGTIKTEKALDHAKAEYRKFDAARKQARIDATLSELSQLKAADKALPKPKKSRVKKGTSDGN